VRLSPAELERLTRLDQILGRVRLGGVRRLTAEEVNDLSDLYRHACSLLARLESRGDNPQRLVRLRRLASDAHGVLFRGLDAPSGGALRRAVRLLTVESPRVMREEWRLLALSLAAFYGLALASYFAVSRDLALAFSLLDPSAVSNEIQQLTATAPGEAFRGNFTFGLGESPQTAGWIMVHNMGVGVVFFASALVPPVYAWVLLQNGLMLGTYTAVAGHWGQAGSISSVLWCHGTIEIQTFVLAATAGLVLVRACLAPGHWTRGHALKLAARRAWVLFAPVFPLLFAAGLIEGFVSPHAPTPVRLGIAVATGLALLTWVLVGGRGARATA
jgi:uncharacterized membrane protein SpoIIM required for sporulation